MKNHIHLISLLLFLASVVLRFVILLTTASAILTIFYYIALVLGIIFLGIESFGIKRYADAFVVNNRFHLNIFSYIASIGFFVDFVSDAVGIFHSVDNMQYRMLTSFVPLCIGCVMALLSSFYFVLVGSSFGGSNYDFRQLKIFHLCPLLWAGAKAFCVLDEAVGILQDDASVLKYIVLAFCVCAFFSFVFEVDNTDGAKNYTIFLFRAFYYTGVMYSINELMLFLSGNVSFSVDDGLLGVSILFISAFMYFCEKNILSHTKFEV